MGAEGRLRGAEGLLAAWTRREEVQHRVELLICPAEVHENRPAHLSIPILNGLIPLGFLQIPKNELAADYVFGLEQPYLQLQYHE